MQTALVIVLSASVTLVSCTSHSTQSSERWLDPSEIHPQPTQQSKLTDDQTKRIRTLHAILAEVDTSSMEQAIEDFGKDRNPEKEIRIWEAIANGYQSYCSKHRLDSDGKKDIFGLLLLRSATNDEKEILGHIQLKERTPEDARAVIDAYRGDWGAIEVERK